MLAAVIPAAGQSRRMGQPKINLPWGSATVLGQVVQTLLAGGVEDLVVVVGDVSPQGSQDWPAGQVRCLALPGAAAGDMLASLRFGLQHLRAESAAALFMPADMPAVPVEVVRAVGEAWCKGGHDLVVPSYRMRRGHPWLAGRTLWPEILALPPGKTLRHFLDGRAGQIHYLPVASAGVLFDLDTPQDLDSRDLPGG